MKHFLLAMLLAFPALALEVGDTGPCVVLEDIQPSGTSKNQCIRTPKKKGDFVILEFFHPTCEDCLTNLPILDRLALDVERTATVRLIGVERQKQDLLDFIDGHDSEINVPVSLDLKSAAANTYGVVAVPTLFILNSKHKIIYKHLGALGDEAVAAIKKAVQ